jgi:hypothetical protein
MEISEIDWSNVPLHSTTKNINFEVITELIVKIVVFWVLVQLMNIRLERDLQQTAQCIYIIPCECGRSYSGETGRPVAVQLREHRHNLQQGFLEKSKLVQNAYEKGHNVSLDEARIL